MTTPTKIAVIGAGLIGPRHARTVQADPNAQLVAIVDPTPSGSDLAATLKVPYHKSIAELIASPDKPDGAIICTPNHTHVPVGLELVRAGIHILVEKPISTSIASARDLVDAAKKAGVQILVGHHRRFNSYMLAAKEILKAGKIGDPVAINGVWTTCKPADYFDAPAEWKRTKESGGPILINMIHEIDLMHYLLGPITRVYAEPTPRRRGFEAEEGCAITLRFQSGAVGSFILSDNVPSPHSFEAGTGENPLIPKTGQDFYRVFGTDGTLSVPDLTVWSYEGRPVNSWLEEMDREVVGIDDVKTPFESQLAHFIRVVRGVEGPSCSGQDGIAALVVCEALKRAVDRGGPINVEVVGE